MPKKKVFVNAYTRGLVGPDQEMVGPVQEKGEITFETPPGCWGPMITPKFRGGHEVSKPVEVENCEVGDAVALTVKDVTITSLATSTGVMISKEEAFSEDPFVDKVCPNCGAKWPESVVKGTGEDAIRCKECGAEASPFAFKYGITIAFDEEKHVGVTLDQAAADDVAEQAAKYAALPENAEQHPILLYKPSKMPGTLSRLRPFPGQLGTTPPLNVPDSHNAGDFGANLVGAEHEYGIEEEDLRQLTDGHLDIDTLREGAILICPVKVDGAGIYAGDLHANQGDGELALHTTDVTGKLTVSVEVIKNLKLEGPILLPLKEDLPFIGKPYSKGELRRASTVTKQYDVELKEDMGPMQVIGTGKNINNAVNNAYKRASTLLDMSVPEVQVRSTITGGVEIGRLPGVVHLTLLTPMEKLEDLGLKKFVQRQYS